jgi:hypothetical protein
MRGAPKISRRTYRRDDLQRSLVAFEAGQVCVLLDGSFDRGCFRDPARTIVEGGYDLRLNAGSFELPPPFFGESGRQRGFLRSALNSN